MPQRCRPGGPVPGFRPKETNIGVVPNTRVAQVQFYEAHLTPWTDNATAIGLTAPQIASLGDLIDAARKSLTDAETARDASKAATQTFYNNVAALHTFGSELISTIRLKAVSTNNPEVYNDAQIPPPATPSPVPLPGTPQAFGLTLLESGAVTLTWKCENVGPAATQYEVRRQIDGGAFTTIGWSGKRSFTDENIPAGSAEAVYQVTGSRTTGRGSPGYFTVRLGAGAGGGMTATGSEWAATPRAHSAADASDRKPMATSTVNGRAVSKTLPNGNGRKSRA